MKSRTRFGAAILMASLLTVSSAHAAIVFSNGPLITGTSNTGVTLGEPISAPENFTSGSGLILTTAGISVKAFKAAEDFVLTSPTQLTSFTIYAFQSQSSALAGTKTPTVTAARVNLWTAMPDDGVTPVLATSLVLAPTSSTFAAWRQSNVPGVTNGTRPVFAYTFPLTGLPDGGLLNPGTYWLEWVLENGTSTSNLFTPLVTPREQAFNRNLRLFGVPFAGSPARWFETYEGGDPNTPRPAAAPILIEGNVVPEPAGLGLLLAAVPLLCRRRR